MIAFVVVVVAVVVAVVVVEVVVLFFGCCTCCGSRGCRLFAYLTFEVSYTFFKFCCLTALVIAVVAACKTADKGKCKSQCNYFFM